MPFKVSSTFSEDLSSGVLTANVDCLAKNSYNESKCVAQVDALYECCNAFYEKFGDNAKTASCPKPSLLRLKMKQKQQGIQ